MIALATDADCTRAQIRAAEFAQRCADLTGATMARMRLAKTPAEADALHRAFVEAQIAAAESFADANIVTVENEIPK